MDIEAYILIGGRSSRLGTHKAFIEIDGKSLATRALNAIRESGIASKVTFVAGSETQFAMQAMTLDAPLIFDLVEARGPLGGLHAALSYAQTQWIFLFACDFPFMASDLIKVLATSITDDVGAVVPVQPDGRMQPLCAFYNVKNAHAVVEQIIHSPRISPPMRDIVNTINPKIIDEYATLPNVIEMFTNINSYKDLSQASRRVPF